MRGIIFMWYGAILDIPDGWALCDGTQSTPNLKNHFILGAGLTYDPDQKFVPPLHNHAFTGDGHVHNVGPGNEILAGVNLEFETSSEPAIGNTGFTKAFPPYHALCYIMKLP